MLNEKLRLHKLLFAKRTKQLEASFYEFVKDAFEILHNSEKIIDNWHIQYLCEVLQEEVIRIIENRNRKQHLIINIPPRSLKSFISTICLPAWAWIKKPNFKYVGSSYSANLSIDHNMLCRRLIESNWYREQWGNAVEMADDQNTKGQFENKMGGVRRATSTGGTITGSGADIIALDDPINPQKARSDIERKTANVFFDHTLSTRLNKPDIGLFLIIMQRLHEDDLTGHLLKKNPDAYRHICIPAIKTKDVRPMELGKFYKDNLFFQERFSKKNLDSLRKDQGSFVFAGQILQSPSPEEGGIIKKKYFKYYSKIPDKFDSIMDSWDCSFKGNATSDYVAGTVWGIKDANRYLLYATHKKMGFVDTINEMLKVRKMYNVTKTLIEDKANGTAIIEVLKNKLGCIIPFDPGSRSKEERLHSVEPDFESGNILLPVYDIATFEVEEYVEELIKFPNGAHDDYVDSTSMLILYTKSKNTNTLEAMGLL